MTETQEHKSWLRLLCDLNAAIGGSVLLAMAGMTVVSVIGRAFFAHPILGDVELVQLGCAVVVSSFLPYTQLHKANIIVDFFVQNASARAQRLMDALGCALYTLVMALIVWRVAVGAIDMRQAGERSMLMDLPLWWPYVLMLPGFALCVAIGVQQTWQLLQGAEGEAA